MYPYTHLLCLAIATICTWKPVWSLWTVSPMYRYKIWFHMQPLYSIYWQSLGILWKFNMNIKMEPCFKWYVPSKGSSKFNNPLHICIILYSNSWFDHVSQCSSHLQIVKCWDPPPRSFGRKLLMIQNQSLVAPVNHGWSTYPPLTYPRSVR